MSAGGADRAGTRTGIIDVRAKRVEELLGRPRRLEAY
jgi:hypothetical protein